MLDNKTFKMIRYDIREGNKSNYIKYFILLLVSIACCMMDNVYLNDSVKLGRLTTEGTFIDYVLYMFKGMEIYIPNNDETFKLPVVWLMIQIMIQYVVGYYPFNDMYMYGQQILIRSKNRGIWWGSKCIWNIVSVIISYMIMYAGIVLYCLCRGIKFSMNINDEIALEQHDLLIENLDNTYMVIILIVMPILISIAISLLQMVLSFIVGPLISFISIAGMWLISAYTTDEALVGSYSMFYRNKYISEQGFTTTQGVVVAIVISAVSIIGGYIIFNHYDILEKN